jgi:hypothetical protein
MSAHICERAHQGLRLAAGLEFYGLLIQLKIGYGKEFHIGSFCRDEFLDRNDCGDFLARPGNRPAGLCAGARVRGPNVEPAPRLTVSGKEPKDPEFRMNESWSAWVH